MRPFPSLSLIFFLSSTLSLLCVVKAARYKMILSVGLSSQDEIQAMQFLFSGASGNHNLTTLYSLISQSSLFEPGSEVSLEIWALPRNPDFVPYNDIPSRITMPPDSLPMSHLFTSSTALDVSSNFTEPQPTAQISHDGWLDGTPTPTTSAEPQPTDHISHAEWLAGTPTPTTSAEPQPTTQFSHDGWLDETPTPTTSAERTNSTTAVSSLSTEPQPTTQFSHAEWLDETPTPTTSAERTNSTTAASSLSTEPQPTTQFSHAEWLAGTPTQTTSAHGSPMTTAHPWTMKTVTDAYHTPAVDTFRSTPLTLPRTTSGLNYSDAVCWLDEESTCSGGIGAACLCIPGFTRRHEGGCAACPAGFFKGSYGDEPCVQCPDGLIAEALEASTQCIGCPQGYFAMSNARECLPCKNGIVKNSTKMSPNCMAVECEAGFIPSADGLSCVQCPEHWYQAGRACLPCPRNAFTEGPGATECIFPPSAPTENCTAGSVRSADGTVCVPCPRNWYQSANEACMACPRNAFTEGPGATECIFPPSAPPENCTAGSVRSADGTVCVPCPRNWYQSGDEACVPCPAHSFTEEGGGATECSTPAPRENCTAGSVRSADGTVCVPCPPGWYQEHNACLPCEKGWFALHGAPCTPCAPGTFSRSTASKHCEECPVGFYAPSWGLSACLSCVAGVSLPPVGGVECNTMSYCPRGQYFSNRTTPHANAYQGCTDCTVCGHDLYTSAECAGMHDTGCTPCIRECPAQSTMTRYCTLYSDTVCQPICRPGEVRGVNATCVPCPRGTVKHHDNDGGRCEPCPSGTYSDQEAAIECKMCDVGGFPNGAKTGCVKECEHGASMQAKPFGTSFTIYCELCSPGTFFDRALGECSPCPANTFSSQWGQLLCEPCPADGSISFPGSSRCSLQVCLLA